MCVTAGATTFPASWRRAAVVAFALFVLVYGTLSLLRFATFHSRSLDMAYYVRLVWGVAHGSWDLPVVAAPHVLGLHLEPILLPFAILARLGLPIAETLLVTQAIVTGAAIFPAHALARRHLAGRLGERTAFAAALSIYLLPTVTRCVDYDFHPATMAVTPLLAWVAALDAGRTRASWIWLALGLACREDVGLQAAAVGATLALVPRAGRPGDRPTGLAITALGLVWFFGYALLVQPRWLPEATTGSYGAHFARFGGGQGGVGGVLAHALADPLGLAAYLLSEGRPLYPLLLVAQLALLPLLSPRWLIGALPIVGINLLSGLEGVRTVQAHYVTAAAPFLVAAGLAGAGRLAARDVRAGRAATWALVTCAAGFFLLRGASPLAPEWRASAYVWDDAGRRMQALARGTPPDAEVAGPSRLIAHLAERPVVRWARWPAPPARPSPPPQ